MNNSFLAIESVSLSVDEPLDLTETLKEQEGKLLRIIEALQTVQDSKGWSTLKADVFDGLVESLNRAITSEARKENPDTLKLNRLAGQLKWAEQYADLGKLEQMFRQDLANIRRKYGKT